ncbi:MAG: type II toxin-antitoxin system RatA family toxin [Hyphomicrobiales bacterium]|nr:type II toxin-antitoxin system RatA family toxin [Hyphomicrobiales bacterium]MDE2114236.1 type II toxin-antitoxin system RatA family toxin [Hyphomicrobiales bacterium]
MPSFESARQVKHSAANMFDLVANVEDYPKFVPLCQTLRVRSRRINDAGDTVLIADMTVGYKAIRETFGSRVTLDRKNLTILVEYIDGPFSSLQNRWNFIDLGTPEAPLAKVEFFITYEFKSRTFAMLMGSMFDTAFRKFAAAFEARADVVYRQA